MSFCRIMAKGSSGMVPGQPGWKKVWHHTKLSLNLVTATFPSGDQWPEARNETTGENTGDKTYPASRGWLWSVCFAAVLLASHMLNTLWQEKNRHEQFNQQMVPLDNISDFSAQYLARSITQLTDEGKILTTCVNTFDVTRWGCLNARRY